MIPLALSTPQGIWNSPTINCRPTGQVRAPLAVVRRRAQTYSFQAPMAMKTVVAAMPWRASGRTIRISAPRRVEPSTRDASSRSGGMPSKEPLEHPDAEGQQEGRVGQGQSEMGIEQAQIAQHDEKRDQQQGEREHADDQVEDHQAAAAPKAIAGDAVGRDRPDRQGHQHRHPGDDSAVAEQMRIAGALPEGDVVLEGQGGRQPVEVARDDLVLRLERRQHGPDDRPDRKEHDRQHDDRGQDIEEQPGSLERSE